MMWRKIRISILIVEMCTKKECTQTDKCPFYEEGTEQCVYEVLASSASSNSGMNDGLQDCGAKMDAKG